MSTLQHPIHLLCPSCGAPVRYRIEDNVYHCTHCGNNTPPGEKVKRNDQWRLISRKRLQEEIHEAKTAVYDCPGCGASVMIAEKEAAGTCSFCGGSLVRRAFTEKDTVPESVIPFRIDEETAKEKLLAWVKRHGSRLEKAAVLKNIDALHGYYLPYQFVRGPIECEVQRDSGHRKYHCGGYVDEIAVSAVKNLNNEVLDAAEPFAWEECREFHLGYIAGYRVRMPDIPDEELIRRTEQEVKRGYLPVVEKTMHTKGLTLTAHTPWLEKLPVLLPMYVISLPDLTAAVNGQTGETAVSLNRYRDLNRYWFVEPLLTTLAVFLAAFLFSRSVGVGLMFAVTAGLIAFTAFGQVRNRHMQLAVSSSKPKADKSGQAVPVFREEVDGTMRNVRISFYPLGRIFKHIILILLFNLMPMLICFFIRLFSARSIFDLQFQYISIWLVLSVPFTFIFWIAWLRRDLFDAPVLYVIEADGSEIRLKVRKTGFLKGFQEVIRSDDLGGALLIGVLPVLMFVMSIVLMLE